MTRKVFQFDLAPGIPILPGVLSCRNVGNWPVPRSFACIAALFALTLWALLVPSPGPAFAAPPDGVHEQAILYEEDTSDPKGRQFTGSVVWQTESIKFDGKPDEIAPRALVDFPPHGPRMTMSFRCNLDPSLPTTHVISLTFAVPADFNNGGIANVPGVLMKFNPQARGTPLAGLAVKVGDGSFLFGLAAELSQVKHNAKALREHAWFDIPIVYANQHRAILAVDKGRSGNKVFKTALTAWEQCPDVTQPAATAPKRDGSTGNAR